MTQKKPVALIGRLAVQLKLITMDQLVQATTAQSRTGQGLLGEVFLEMGFINEKQLAKLNEVQKDVVAKHRAKQASSGRAVPAAQRPSPQTRADGPPAAPSPVRSKEEILATAAQAAVDAAPVTSAVVEEIAQAPPAVAKPAAPAPTTASSPSAAPAQRAVPAPPPVREPVREPQTAPAQPQPVATQAVDGSPSLELVLPAADASDRGRLEQLLTNALESGASDIHIHSEGTLKLRVNGELIEQSSDALTQEEAARMVCAALTEQERTEICASGEIDYCFDLPGVGRFRANAYRQQRGFDTVFRSISAEPPTLDELGLPQELAKYTNYHQGMVLITGPAGCGKSSRPWPRMVNLINEEREEHILTIEDPIEVRPPVEALPGEPATRRAPHRELRAGAAGRPARGSGRHRDR